MHTGNINPCDSFGNNAQFFSMLDEIYFFFFFWLNVFQLHRGGSQSQCLIGSISFEPCNPYFVSKHVLLYMYSKKNSLIWRKQCLLKIFVNCCSKAQVFWTENSWYSWYSSIFSTGQRLSHLLLCTMKRNVNICTVNNYK